MTRSPEPLSVHPDALPARDRPQAIVPDRAAPPYRIAREAHFFAEPLEDHSRPAGAAPSTGRDWEHTRDMLAMMMAILAAHDGIVSARKTALACWQEANDMARMLSGRPDPPPAPAATGRNSGPAERVKA